jgi:hypothetical protein
VKLYIVVRSDLPPGLQAAQAVHAAFSFACEYPEEMRRWHLESNFIVVLNAHNEVDLACWWARIAHAPCRVIVHEPDIGNRATAFAVLGEEAGRQLSSLPLALRERAMT